MPSPVPHSDFAEAALAAGEAARSELEAWSNAAFVVDPQAASLLAANGPGRALFPALPLVLDGAMPAVRALRAFARSGGDTATAVPLVFWTAAGLEALTCDVQRMAGGPLLLVRAATGMRPDSDSASIGQRLRSDEDTLQEIARKIREGQARFLAAAPPAAGNARPNTPEIAALPAEAVTGGIDLAKLAHELKTPLSAITAASEIMKEGRFGTIENERYAGYISDIHASARHALDLIQRMLDQRGDPAVSRMPKLQFEKIALDDLMESCVSSVRPLASAKGLALTAHRSQAPVSVTADATALKQIVLNLLTNAMKFTPEGGTIRVSTVGSQRGAAALTVEDTGPGMTAVAIAEALQPVPLDVPQPRKGGGLGIGLPLSRALTEAMGAALSIDSAPGRGTRVTISFPGGPLVAV